MHKSSQGWHPHSFPFFFQLINGVNWDSGCNPAAARTWVSANQRPVEMFLLDRFILGSPWKSFFLLTTIVQWKFSRTFAHWPPLTSTLAAQLDQAPSEHFLGPRRYASRRTPRKHSLVFLMPVYKKSKWYEQDMKLYFGQTWGRSWWKGIFTLALCKVSSFKTIYYTILIDPISYTI